MTDATEGSKSTRRSFLTKGAVGAAATVAALSVPSSAFGAVAKGDDGDDALTAAEQRLASMPLVVHLRDASSGEFEALIGEHSVVFRNKALVAKLLRAAG